MQVLSAEDGMLGKHGGTSGRQSRWGRVRKLASALVKPIFSRKEKQLDVAAQTVQTMPVLPNLQQGQPSHRQNLDPLDAHFFQVVFRTMSSDDVDHLIRDIEAHPEAASTQDAGGATPLHWFAGPGSISNAKEQHLKMLRVLLKVHPEAASMQDEHGALPVHWFVGTCDNATAYNVEMLRMLLKAYPEAASTKDAHDAYPLHCLSAAAMATASRGTSMTEHNVAMLEELLKAHPEAASRQDRLGAHALHWFVGTVNNANLHNVEMLRMLLKAYPEAARSKDSFGALPLHCMAGAAMTAGVRGTSMTEHNVEMLEELLEAHPEAARSKDRGGREPLAWLVKGFSTTASHTHSLKMLRLLAPPEGLVQAPESPSFLEPSVLEEEGSSTLSVGKGLREGWMDPDIITHGRRVWG